MAAATRRVLKLFADSGLWKPIGKVHAWVYRRTGGRIGHRTGHISNLLLTTRGRRSGQPRTVTLAYMADGDNYVVVGSNGGADRHPLWWLNLQQNPRAEVQIGGRTARVEAVEAGAPERARLWTQLKAYNPLYARYEQITERRIPVIILRPQPPASC